MTPEGAVVKAIMDLLAAERIPAWRMNTGAVKTEKRFFRFGEKGMADILAMPDCNIPCGHMEEFEAMSSLHSSGSYHPTVVPLWIEAKAPRGRQTEEQKSFENYVTENGMAYLVARSSDDVLAWLKGNR